MSRLVTRLAVAAWLLAGHAAAAQVSDPAAYLMDEAEERRLAATAGPATITEGATYHVLRRTGYAKVAEGTNGFHCFVERSWGAPSRTNAISFVPKVRAPHCINREGARTKLEEIFLVAELAMAGHGSDAINAALDRAYARGDLELPKGLALTYMMSKHQWLGERVGAFKPHVMLWIPYLTEADVGAIANMRTPNAMLGGKPGSRQSVLVFMVPDFIG